MCIRDRQKAGDARSSTYVVNRDGSGMRQLTEEEGRNLDAVSYTHLRAHETVLDLVCRLLLEKKKNNTRIINTQCNQDIPKHTHSEQTHKM